MTDVKPQDIEALVRTFDESNWDELRVVIDGAEIYLSKNPADRHQTVTSVAPVSAASASVASGRAASAASAPTHASKAAMDIPPGQVPIKAPNLGTFYRSPKPGAQPYVEIGQKVTADTEICLIEVMKLFTPVRAGIAGTVRKVLAEDAQLVEYDQPLFLIEP
jgi:acetyl-CoA carboxylase biotin carboxyl carrier protein